MGGWRGGGVVGGLGGQELHWKCVDLDRSEIVKLVEVSTVKEHGNGMDDGSMDALVKMHGS